MTQQLIELIERVKTWPVERQKDAARLLEAMEGSGTSVYRLSDDERRAVDVGPAAFEDVAEISQAHEIGVAARLEHAVFAATDRLGERPELGVATDD